LKFIYFKGVKSLKRDMMESLERRTGDFETKEQYALSCALDPRYFLSSFSNVENGKAARLLLIQRVKEYIGKEDIEPRVERSTSTSSDDVEESWQQLAKRRKTERQEEASSFGYSKLQQNLIYSVVES